jgi:repressor LexA
MGGLTEKQRSVMEFIESHISARGYPPTVREIGERFGFTWPAARGHLIALRKKGAIRTVPFKSRGIEVMGRPRTNAAHLPLVGTIRAGRPIPALEDIQEHISVDRNLFRDRDAFVLRVTGDSMKEAGIFDGDYVIVSPGKEVPNGGIGVALIGDEATVKKIYVEKGSVTLAPSNSAMSPATYMPDEVSLLGRVTGVIRKL